MASQQGRERRAPGRARARARALVLAVALAAVATGASAAASDAASDEYAQLLAGVDDLDLDFHASRIQLLSSSAFPLAAAEDGVYVAAAVSGAGRVVAFGHEAMLTKGASGEGGAGAQTLIGNVLAWLASADGAADEVRLVVQSSYNNGQTAAFAAAASAALPSDASVTTQRVTWMPEGLVAGRDVAVVNFHDLEVEDIHSLLAFVAAGGGVLGGGHAWWWAYSNDNDNAYANHPANALLVPLGLGLDSRTVGSTVLSEVPSELPGGEYNLWSVGAALEAFGADVLDQGSAEEEMALTTIADALAFVPADADAELWAAADAAFSSSELEVGHFPLRYTGLAKLALVVAETREQHLPASSIEPSAWARGSCSHCQMPADATKRRTVAKLTVNASYPGRNDRFFYSSPDASLWISTGLYLAPGEAAEVGLPPAAVRSGCVSLQVGAHSDELHQIKRLERPPKITRTFAVETNTTTVANAHGGLLYLVVEPGCTAGEVEMQVEGAYDAPRFVLGVTDPDDYIKAVTSPLAAPWTELECESLILTVRTVDAAAAASEATAVMEHWERAMQLGRDLASEGRPYVRKERIVSDVQISVGWMHSGYPIMGHLEHSALVVSVDELCGQGTGELGGWGPYHELGHNFQGRDWMLPGTDESSCNLFSLIIAERECGMQPGRGHPARSPESVLERWEEYSAAKYPDFSVWFGLDFFMELQSALGGWEALAGVLATYASESTRTCDPCTLENVGAGWSPASERARFDLLMARSAVALGARGLEAAEIFGPNKWRLPVSDAALESILEAEWGESPSEADGGSSPKKKKKSNKKDKKKKRQKKNKKTKLEKLSKKAIKKLCKGAKSKKKCKKGHAKKLCTFSKRKGCAPR